MSIYAIDWAMRRAPVTDPTSTLILVGLGSHAQDDGTDAFPSRATLAQYARCSVRTVARYLAALEEQGVIARGDQELVSHRPVNRRPVVYNLNLLAGTSVTKTGVSDSHVGQGEPNQGVGQSDWGDSGGNLGVTRMAHNTSFNTSIENPNIDAVAEYSTSSRNTDFNEGEWPAIADTPTPTVESSTSITGAKVFIRDGVEAFSADPKLAAGVELPKSNRWKPSDAAMDTARDVIHITDITLHIARYTVTKAEQRKEPQSGEWLRWIIEDEKRAKAEQVKEMREVRSNRPWHGVAD